MGSPSPRARKTETTMNPLYDNLSGDESPRFRLLRLFPSASADAAIKLSLETVPLSDGVIEYEALSYCWGDPSQKRPIECNGREFTVTENLDASLRAVRLPGPSRILWIDAICVNQDNLAEREQQVGYMRDIYCRAKRVLVWLGTEADDSALVFPLCKRITSSLFRYVAEQGVEEGLLVGVKEEWARQSFQDSWFHFSQGQRSSDTNDANGPVPVLGAQDPEVLTGIDISGFGGHRVARARVDEFQALLKLLQRPWWTRSWVIQEICLAREATLFCGSSTIEWHMIVVSFLLIFLEAADSQLLPKAVRDYPLSMIRIRTKIKQPDTPAHDTLSLLDLLWDFRSQQSTDARDKVFAFLGLVPPADAVHSRVRPDYRTDAAQCYRQTVLAFLSLRANLDVLATERHPDACIAPSLPSWVPDWSFSDSRTITLPLQVRTPPSADCPSGIRPFTASGPCDTYVATTNPEDPQQLLLSGYVVDRLVALEAPLPPLFEVELDGLLLTEEWLPSWSKTKPFFSSVGIHFDVLLRWEKLARTARIEADPLRALVAVLCAGNMPNGVEAAHAAFLIHRANLRWPRRVARLQRVLPRDAFHLLLGLSSLIAAGPKYDVSEDESFIDQMVVSTSRRLARTERSYLALVPKHARVGDGVAVCRGGKLPLVVREKGEGEGVWELMGCSYVHGIMFGEAWDEARCETMAIV